VFHFLFSRTALVSLSVFLAAEGALPPPCRAADVRETIAHLLSPEMRRLDGEEQTLHEQLRDLPPVPAREITGRLGHHSGYVDTQDTVEWVELTLRESHLLDAVVLIATPSDGGGEAQAGYGFPLRFRVDIAGDGEDAQRVVIADQTREDFPNPGVLPVYLQVPGVRARRVRVTATRLASDGDRFFFSLGEVMVLSGGRNVAIGMNRIDFTTSRTRGAVPMWGLANLVDGHIACGPPVGTQASPTLGYQSAGVDLRTEPNPAARWVQVDWGESLPIDEVRLFPARSPDFPHRKGFGYPPQATLALSTVADGSAPEELQGFYDTPRATPPIVNPGDNVITYDAGGKRARCVRFTARQLFNANGLHTVALAEMQVWSGGRNVALGKAVSSLDSTDTGGWSEAALVDGFTSTGNILDWPDWLSGLSRRRELMQRAGAIEARKRELIRRVQAAGFVTLGVVAGAGAMAAGAWFIREQRARLHEMEALRLRIAQDLHDEIGSSLGSIALIAQDVLVDDTHAHQDLAEIKSIADETVHAMRDITRLVQSDRYGTDDLPLLLRSTAERMLRGISHGVHVEESGRTCRLPVDRQRDLMLIFKEALNNISRHAAATDVKIRLVRRDDALVLTVQDNGRGFEPAAATAGMGLANLHRRAEKYRGSAAVESSSHGTTLTITLPLHD
jgi:signal transduction histidine kinase